MCKLESLQTSCNLIRLLILACLWKRSCLRFPHSWSFLCVTNVQISSSLNQKMSTCSILLYLVTSCLLLGSFALETLKANHNPKMPNIRKSWSCIHKIIAFSALKTLGKTYMMANKEKVDHEMSGFYILLIPSYQRVDANLHRKI